MRPTKILVVFALTLAIFFVWRFYQNRTGQLAVPINPRNQTAPHPLSIEAMRQKAYPGSVLQIEKALPDGRNYHQYLASYLSEGLKIYGLLTIPQGSPPPGGWPAIIFNHGYIQPDLYQTTERYVAYVTAFAQNGYLVFKPDYRGHGQSEGLPEGAYYSPAYATDVLNALASIKKYEAVNLDKIGMWGHSLGGNIVLRDIVVNTQDIKAAVIWSGVVGSYNDLMNNWQRRVSFRPPPREMTLRNTYRSDLINTHGTPQTNPEFWNSLDPTFHLADIATPVQLHAGDNDQEVPLAFSASLKDKLEQAGKTVEFYQYPGGDHNLSSPDFEVAIQKSLAFFDKYLKNYTP